MRYLVAAIWLLLAFSPSCLALDSWSLWHLDNPRIWPQGPALHGNSVTTRAAQLLGKAQGEGITVAVIDGGANLQHEDIAPNLWVNPYERLDGLDNDSNGYPDDLHGVDFTGSDMHKLSAHGTHTASVIAAPSNNKGGQGVAPKARLMILRVLDRRGGGNNANLIKALSYACRMRVQVINLSIGGYGSSPGLKKAIKCTERVGALVVLAAGNRNENRSVLRDYPLSYHNPNLIRVAAHDQEGRLEGYSAYGPTIDLAAPGSSIFGADKWGYTPRSGTSQAAAVVSGAAALLFSLPERPSWLEVKAALIKGSIGKYNKLGGGRLDLVSAYDHLRFTKAGTSK